MQYKSINALCEFSFEEASVAEIQFYAQTFSMDLDNVTILSSNSHNRDIQDMRANNVMVTFQNATIEQVVAEGYKVYDANENLISTIADTIVPVSDYTRVFHDLEGCFLYSIVENASDNCTIHIDTEDQTYCITLSYTQSLVEWDKFLKKNN